MKHSEKGNSVSRIGRIVIFWLMGIFIFIGLPLLGWGIIDVQGFVSNHERLSYIVDKSILATLAALALPNSWKSLNMLQKITSQRDFLLIEVLSLALLMVGPFDDRHAILTPPDSVMLDASGLNYMRTTGLILFPSGILIVMFAELTRRKPPKDDATPQEDRTLSTDGVYAHMRHPSYLGIILFLLSIALIFRSGMGVIIVAVQSLVLIRRIQREEALLHQEFGAEWEAYTAATPWRLIPHLY